MFRLLTASLHQAMESTGYASPFVARWSELCLVDFDPHHYSVKMLFPHRSADGVPTVKIPPKTFPPFIKELLRLPSPRTYMYEGTTSSWNNDDDQNPPITADHRATNGEA